MSFWKKLFGGSDDAADTPARSFREADHNGFRIQAVPYAEAGQFQTAGVISKDVDGVEKQHRFVRADRFGSREEAADFAILKGQQIIDQQGERIFD